GDALGGVNEGLLVAGAFEITGEGVIVARRDRIKLVVMTARAGNRLRQERFAQDINLVIDDIGLLLADIDWGLLGLPHPEKPSGQNGFIELLDPMAARAL